jgi:hypothetical protein
MTLYTVGAVQYRDGTDKLAGILRTAHRRDPFGRFASGCPGRSSTIILTHGR